MEVKTIKAEQDFELPTPTRTCPKNRVAFSGGRSKQHLTEVMEYQNLVHSVNLSTTYAKTLHL